MNITEIMVLLADVYFQDYDFVVSEVNGSLYLQALYIDNDISSQDIGIQKTRKWLLSPHMTRSEIVQTAFKCALTSMEHRTREGFKYKGRRIFGPHFDVDALWGICTKDGLDYRSEP